MPQKFFITHSWEDIGFTRKLCDDLIANGLEGFFDAYSIQPGDDIPARIAKGLEECEIYVPLLSPAALKSRWSELEINAAITLNRNNGHPRIIPVIVEKCDVPTLLRPMLYISFVGWKNENVYQTALNDLLTKGFGVALMPLHPPRPHVIVPEYTPQSKPIGVTQSMSLVAIRGIFVVVFLGGVIGVGAWVFSNLAMPTAKVTPTPIGRIISTQTPWIIYAVAPAGWVWGTPFGTTPLPIPTYRPLTPTPWIIYVPVTATPVSQKPSPKP